MRQQGKGPDGSRPIAAVIFDLDGVLVDSEPLGYQIVNHLLTEYGVAMDWDDYRSIIGTTISPWEILTAKHALLLDREVFSNRFWSELERRVAAGELTALPGVRDALAHVHERGLPLGLASSSRRSYVAGVLRSLGVMHLFAAIVCREDVVTGKPDPAPFLEAARRLGVEPAVCLAIEDSPAGLAAARAAGMRALAVRTVYTREDDLREAHFILPSLEGLDLSRLTTHHQSP